MIYEILAIPGLVPEAGSDTNATLVKVLVGDSMWIVPVFWGMAIFLSLSAVATIWVRHGAAPILRKLVWSMILLFPYLGWVFWIGFFSPPKRRRDGGAWSGVLD